MKRFLKLLSMLLTTVILCISLVPLFVSAESQISPCYVNTNTCDLHFDIAGNSAESVVTYIAQENTFSYASVYVKIQKRFLGVFWSTVDEWTETCYDVYGTLYHITTLEDTGTYRAVFTVEIYGKDGSVDTIEDKITSTYE